MNNGFMYFYKKKLAFPLCIVMGISNTHDSEFCWEVHKDAISKYGAPEILNTEHGIEFKATAFIDILKK